MEKSEAGNHGGRTTKMKIEWIGHALRKPPDSTHGQAIEVKRMKPSGSPDKGKRTRGAMTWRRCFGERDGERTEKSDKLPGQN